MKVSQEFIDAVNGNDKIMVRIMLKDSMVYDPTMADFNMNLEYAEQNMLDLYDEHDGEVFSSDKTVWTKELLDKQMVNVIGNFSKERVAFLIEMCKHIYKSRIEEFEHAKENAPKTVVSQKQVGIGLTAAGATAAIAGIVVSKPAVIGIGLAVAVAGGIIIATDK